MLSQAKLPRLLGGRGYFWLGIVVLLGVISLFACTAPVQVVKHGPARPSLPVATVAPQSHALAVLGVDFDPPLAQQQSIPPDGVSLLVAIENQGLSDESNVNVSAHLLDATKPERPELRNETVLVKSLRAGEMRFVRFTQVSAIPQPVDRYQLAVELGTVRGEMDTSDNRLVFDVLPRGDK